MSTFQVSISAERLALALRTGHLIRVARGLPVGLQGVPARLTEVERAVDEEAPTLLLYGQVDDGRDEDLGEVEVELVSIEP